MTVSWQEVTLPPSALVRLSSYHSQQPDASFVGHICNPQKREVIAMDVVRLDIATPVNTLRQLAESGWSPERRLPLHLLLADWDLRETAAWTGMSPEALRADWQYFLELGESAPPEPA